MSYPTILSADSWLLRFGDHTGAGGLNGWANSKQMQVLPMAPRAFFNGHVINLVNSLPYHPLIRHILRHLQGTNSLGHQSATPPIVLSTPKNFSTGFAEAYTHRSEKLLQKFYLLWHHICFIVVSNKISHQSQTQAWKLSLPVSSCFFYAVCLLLTRQPQKQFFQLIIQRKLFPSTWKS